MPDDFALCASELKHIKELLEKGFADTHCELRKVDERLKTLNGTVRDHTTTLALHQQDITSSRTSIERLEAWQRGFNSSMLRAVGIGAGVVVTAAGILFALGRFAGLW